MYNPNYDFFAPKGWQCPKCGRIYSPSTPMCWYCDGQTVTNSPTTSTPINWDEYLRKTVISSDDTPPVTLNSETFEFNPGTITYATSNPTITIKYNPNKEDIWFIN